MESERGRGKEKERGGRTLRDRIDKIKEGQI